MPRVLILLAIVVAVVWWLFGRANRAASKGGPGGRARRRAEAEEMVACAHCGVHLPRADAVIDGDALYCGDEHRPLGQRRP